MSKLKKIMVFTALLWPLLAGAQSAVELSALFAKGTKAYVAKDYPQAEKHFTQALDLDPHNATLLTNLALAKFQLDKKYLAIGLLRKALHYDPNLQTAHDALKFTLQQLPDKGASRKIESYESFRAGLLLPVPLVAYLTLSALCFLAAGWAWIAYFGQRKNATADEKSPPTFPVIATILSLGFFLFTGLVILKIYDSTILRATTIEEKVSLQTAPGDSQVVILELGGGLEVIVREHRGDWVQATYPGSITGWVKKSAVLMTR